MHTLKCVNDRQTATGRAILESGPARDRNKNNAMIHAVHPMPLCELAAEDGLDVRQARAERLGFFLEAEPVGAPDAS